MTSPPGETTAPARPRPAWRAIALDVAIVAVWFVVAGLLGALAWWKVTPLPKVTKAGDAVMLTGDALVSQVGIDGWFFVVAGVGGLASGVALLAWRRRDPLLMVVLLALGGALAAYLMVRVGLALGPGEETAALRKLADGAEVPMQLKLHAPGVAWTWPIGATLGALLYLWIGPRPAAEEPEDRAVDPGAQPEARRDVTA